MSNEEKNQQIADAVRAHQAAKAERGHIEKRLTTIFENYRAVGVAGASYGPFAAKVTEDILYIASSVSAALSGLISGEELRALIDERDRAHDRFLQTKQDLADLGVTLS